jgi:hypothetical protein
MDINVDGVFKDMEEINAGVTKFIIHDKDGRRSKALIFVNGVEEVEEIIEAIDCVEESWE